jgi:hypothetical protein
MDYIDFLSPAYITYYEFLLKIITDYPFKHYSRYGSEIDQFCIKEAISAYNNDNITGSYLFDFSNRVQAVTTNPKVYFHAYIAMAHYYLDIDDFVQAQIIAINALKYHDFPLIGYKDVPFNSQPAIMCIAYMIRNEANPDNIVKLIDLFDSITPNFPEFHNFLMYLKTELKDPSADSDDDIIAAYHKLNANSKRKRYNFQGAGDYTTVKYRDKSKLIFYID